MTTTNNAHLSGAGQAVGYPSRAGVIGWLLFDWAAQPYFTLITTFVFAPYFANFVAPDPATGQALWGFAAAAAGFCIAALSPVLGAIADASGRRKPWIAVFGALLVAGASAMWIGRPGDPSIIAPLLLFVHFHLRLIKGVPGRPLINFFKIFIQTFIGLFAKLFSNINQTVLGKALPAAGL